MDSEEPITDKNWLRLFPAELSLQENSAKFVLRGIYLIFSTALRYRKALPRDCFESRLLSEFVKAIMLSTKDKIGARISERIRELRDAIFNGYLKEVALVLYPDEKNEEEATEVYKIQVAYANGSASMDIICDGDDGNVSKVLRMEYEGNEKTKNQFLCIMRVLVDLCAKTMKPFEKAPCISIRVKLNQETPADFKLGGYHDSDFYYKLKDETQLVTVGNSRANYHGIYLTCASEYIEDAYCTEIKLKGVYDKMVAKMGLNNNSTLYQTFDSQESWPAIRMENLSLASTNTSDNESYTDKRKLSDMDFHLAMKKKKVT